MSRFWEGHLVVLEGGDCAGRSTQTGLLKRWLQQEGRAVAEAGLGRSSLVGDLIEQVNTGTPLGTTTRSLLDVTDLADQLESAVIPALRAGFVVLADRYIYSLMARDLVRGVSQPWLEELLRVALVPDLVIYLKTAPEERLHRALRKHGALDYWESGGDLRLSPERCTSFLKYQELLQHQLDRMAVEFGFTVADGSAPIKQVQKELRTLVSSAIRL